VNGHGIESHVLTYFARQQMLNTALVRHLPYLEVTRPCSVLIPNCTYQNKLAMDRKKKMAMLDTLLLLLLFCLFESQPTESSLSVLHTHHGVERKKRNICHNIFHQTWQSPKVSMKMQSQEGGVGWKKTCCPQHYYF